MASEAWLPNPPDRNRVIILPLVLVMTTMPFAFLVVPPSSYVWAVPVTIIVSFITFLQLWRREYYSRPTRVAVVETGLRMSFRYSPELDLTWEQVAAISVRETGLTGLVAINGRFYPYMITNEIARKARQAYRSAKGYDVEGRPS